MIDDDKCYYCGEKGAGVQILSNGLQRIVCALWINSPMARDRKVNGLSRSGQNPLPTTMPTINEGS